MRNATKTAVIGVSALAAALAVAVAAYAGAGTLRGTLTVTPVAGGHYGDELAIAPSLNTTACPGDVVELDYLAADNTWQQYGENLSVEDTAEPDPVSGLTTIGPLAFIVDDSLPYPAVLRAYFKPKASAEGTCVSDPIWIRLQKNAATKVAITAPKTATRNKSYVVTSQVTPVSGIGSIRVAVKRVSNGTTQRFTITTDESGAASFSFKRSAKGTYRITEKFAGNQFGGASGTSSKTIVVK
jgi:hypothetical protein